MVYYKSIILHWRAIFFNWCSVRSVWKLHITFTFPLIWTHFDCSVIAKESWDSWLLPLHTENCESEWVIQHDEYNHAVRCLRAAVYSTPPVLAALIPLIQVCNLGHVFTDILSNIVLEFKFSVEVCIHFQNSFCQWGILISAFDYTLLSVQGNWIFFRLKFEWESCKFKCFYVTISFLCFTPMLRAAFYRRIIIWLEIDKLQKQHVSLIMKKVEACKLLSVAFPITALVMDWTVFYNCNLIHKIVNIGVFFFLV